MHAYFYDILFIVYGFFIVFSLCTYIWTCFVRTQYESKVCAGDFLNEHEIEEESAILVIWDIEHEFYVQQCGTLLNWFIIIESIFFFCCSCASMMWAFV